MISQNGLRALVAMAVVNFCLVLHSPSVLAKPYQAPVTKCPIQSTLSAFVASTKSLGASSMKTQGAQRRTSFTSVPFVANKVDMVRPSKASRTVSMVASVPTETDEAPAPKPRKQSGTSLNVHVLGLSHHNAAVEVREKLAIPKEEWSSAAAELVNSSNGAIEEAAVLSTCNRFEVYFSARDGKDAMRAAAGFLAERSALSQGILRRNLFMLGGEDASWHLLRVSAGLDSLVVGEGQILSQVSSCYQTASGEEGSGGKVLNQMLKQAVKAGKRVRAETAIARGAVSISSAAVEFSLYRSPLDLNMPFKDCRVVIVGAGKMSRLLITHLTSAGISKIVLINRSIGPDSRAALLASEYPDVEWDLRTMDQMYAAVSECDVVFMSTAAEEPILTSAELGPIMTDREPMMVVDISVPRNVESSVADINKVGSYNVDDLKAVVARNTAARKLEILEAEDLLRGEWSEYHGWHQSLGAVPTIAKLQQRAESLRAEEMSKNSKKLKALSDKERDAVDRLSRGIVNKLLHGPLSHLRAPEGPDEKVRTLSTLSALFKLEDDGSSKKGKKRKD